MKRIVLLLLCCVSIGLCAADYTMSGSNYSMPSAVMRSVNNAGYMTSGSTYSSTVYDVASSLPGNSPSKGPRKAPPGGTGEVSDYDPQNPTLSLGDAILPLLLMAFAFMGHIYLRKRKIPMK